MVKRNLSCVVSRVGKFTRFELYNLIRFFIDVQQVQPPLKTVSFTEERRFERTLVQVNSSPWKIFGDHSFDVLKLGTRFSHEITEVFVGCNIPAARVFERRLPERFQECFVKRDLIGLLGKDQLVEEKVCQVTQQKIGTVFGCLELVSEIVHRSDAVIVKAFRDGGGVYQVIGFQYNQLGE